MSPVATASPTPCGSLRSWPAPRLLAQLLYGAQAETGAHARPPQGVPWPCCLCSALWGGKRADLQPEPQHAVEQDSHEFLVTEGPAGSGPWLTSTACRAWWVAPMPVQEPGPGSSASRTPGKQARGTYAEGPSSVRSGSSRQRTASSRPGKEGQGRGLSPPPSRVPCAQHRLLLPSQFLPVRPVPGHCRAQPRDCSGEGWARATAS